MGRAGELHPGVIPRVEWVWALTRGRVPLIIFTVELEGSRTDNAGKDR